MNDTPDLFNLNPTIMLTSQGIVNPEVKLEEEKAGESEQGFTMDDVFSKVQDIIERSLK